MMSLWNCRRSQHHGERHWLRVALAGVKISEMVMAADPVVAVYFGLLHDGRLVALMIDNSALVRGHMARSEASQLIIYMPSKARRPPCPILTRWPYTVS
jgi:hypothetical protein